MPTGSMAPTLLGIHRDVTCTELRIPASPWGSTRTAGPAGRSARTAGPTWPTAPAAERTGDRLLVQKNFFRWRAPAALGGRRLPEPDRARPGLRQAGRRPAGRGGRDPRRRRLHRRPDRPQGPRRAAGDAAPGLRQPTSGRRRLRLLPPLERPPRRTAAAERLGADATTARPPPATRPTARRRSTGSTTATSTRTAADYGPIRDFIAYNGARIGSGTPGRRPDDRGRAGPRGRGRGPGPPVRAGPDRAPGDRPARRRDAALGRVGRRASTGPTPGAALAARRAGRPVRARASSRPRSSTAG